MPELRPPGQGQAYQLGNLIDFSGGLNRDDDTSNIGGNELIELENMDPDPGGGLRVRRAVVDMGDELNGDGLVPIDGWAYKGVSRLHRLGNFGSNLGDIVWGNANGRANVVFWALGDGSRNAQAYPVRSMYQLGGRIVAVRADALGYGANYWPGSDSVLTASGDQLAYDSYEDNYETPTTLGHPRGKFSCVQQNRAWVSENNILGRVRFSHPGNPLYWHTDDWIDLGSDDIEIIGLYALGDFVFIIKQDETWAITGDTLDSIRVEKMHDLLSPYNDIEQELTHCMGGGRVWMWTLNQGLVSVGTDGQLAGHSEKLVRRGRLPEINEISYGGSKVWCRAADLGVSFVYDTRAGNWTTYDYQVRSALDVFEGSGLPSGESPARVLAIDPTRQLGVTSDGDALGNNLVDDEFSIVELDVDLSHDYVSAYGSVGTIAQRQIQGVMRTGWISVETPTERKRWGRPRVVVETYDSMELGLKIEVLKGYEETVTATSHHTVAAAGDGDVVILRGPSGGRTEAVSYRITGLKALMTSDGQIVTSDGEPIEVDINSGSDWGIAAISPRWKTFRIKR